MSYIMLSSFDFDLVHITIFIIFIMFIILLFMYFYLWLDFIVSIFIAEEDW